LLISPNGEVSSLGSSNESAILSSIFPSFSVAAAAVVVVIEVVVSVVAAFVTVVVVSVVATVVIWLVAGSASVSELLFSEQPVITARHSTAIMHRKILLSDIDLFSLFNHHRLRT
jgi:hypothetical protein